PGREPADGGAVEQPNQIRKLVPAGLDVLPRHGGGRDEEEALRLPPRTLPPRPVPHPPHPPRDCEPRPQDEPGRTAHPPTPAPSGARSGASGPSTRCRSTRPPVARTPRTYRAPPTSTITVHSAALAMRPDGSSTETTPQAARPITTERPTARGSAPGRIA